jgi:hypothetical protein
LTSFVNNCYTEFHENPINGSAVDTRSQTDWCDLHIWQFFLHIKEHLKGTGNSEQHQTLRHKNVPKVCYCIILDSTALGHQQIHICGDVNRDADTATYILPEPLASGPNAFELEKLTRYNSPGNDQIPA